MCDACQWTHWILLLTGKSGIIFEFAVGLIHDLVEGTLIPRLWPHCTDLRQGEDFFEIRGSLDPPLCNLGLQIYQTPTTVCARVNDA